jgi:hypothetical protein
MLREFFLEINFFRPWQGLQGGWLGLSSAPRRAEAERCRPADMDF